MYSSYIILLTNMINSIFMYKLDSIIYYNFFLEEFCPLYPHKTSAKHYNFYSIAAKESEAAAQSTK